MISAWFSSIRPHLTEEFHFRFTTQSRLEHFRQSTIPNPIAYDLVKKQRI